RRIVSEDSRCRVASLSAAIHPLSEVDDANVVGVAHDGLAQERDRTPEQLEVTRLPSDERKPLEEGDDSAGDVGEAVDLPVPAVVAGPPERAASQSLVEQVERCSIVLRNVEGGGELPLPTVVAASAAHDHEASLSESETRQEASERARNRFDNGPFLLIARTH